MRRFLPMIALIPMFVLCIRLLDAAGQDKGKAAKGDKAIQGAWTAAKGTGKMTLTFAGAKFTLSKSRGDKNEDITGTVQVDSSKTPKTIDLTVTGGSSDEVKKYMGKTSLGIYRVEGDKLTWCANEPGKEGRPKEFTSKDGDNKYLLITFDQEKK